MSLKILTYNEINREEWSRLVRVSKTGTWFQSPEAYDFFASQPELFIPFAIGLEAYPQPLPEGKGGRASHDQRHNSFASIWGAHTADSTQYNLLKTNAIANREVPTEAEAILWNMLKGNNLGLHFRRQHIILDYIVDFICLDKGLVIELDGGYHNDQQQKEYDEQRTAHLQRLGYTELRFTNEELLVNSDEVIAKIKAVAKKLPSFQGRTEERPVLRGVCVGYVTKEKSAIRQFFTRRAIILGGPAIADDATSEEVFALMSALKDNLSFTHSPIYIETRNFNSYERWKGAFEKAGFEYRKHLNFHVDCTDKDRMWERLSENRKRQIRKGERLSVIGDGGREQEIREWYGILERLYRTKVKTPLWPAEFFLEAHRQGVGRFLLVKHNNHVIGGSMVVVKGLMDEEIRGLGGGCVYEWFECGMNGEYKEQYPSVMATWTGMEYANEHGCARYDMMGAGEPGVPYGVRDFKAEFGGEMVEHGRFVCVNKPLLYSIGKVGVRILRRNYLHIFQKSCNFAAFLE